MFFRIKDKSAAFLRFVVGYFLVNRNGNSSATSCLCCGRICFSMPLCYSCEEQLLHCFSIWPEERCSICGKLLVSEKGKCSVCKSEPLLKSTDFVLSLYPYRLWKKSLLFAWKMENHRALSFFFAKTVDLAIRGFCFQGKPVIVPVPPRPGKIRNNGWDQIDELCRILKTRYGYDLFKPLVRYSKVQQKKLNRNSRLQSSSGSYGIRPAIYRKIPREVILVDDVMTTGATVEICARLLKTLGVSKVNVITIFIVD